MRPAASRDSVMMLAALGLIAYAASMLTHEALGHGGYCLAAGGRTTSLTLWWETCHFPGAPQLGIKAAGPVVQYGAGLLAWRMLQRVPPGAARSRYLLWLYMTFSLLISSGYVAFTGVLNAGDGAELIAPLPHPLLWRAVLLLLGSGIYFLSMRAAALELKRFAGSADDLPRLFRLVSIPYISAGVFACCTAAINPAVRQGGLAGLAVASPGLHRLLGSMGMAAASSFGAGAGLFALPPLQRGMRLKLSAPSSYLRWSAAWAAVAGTVVLLFFFVGT